MMEDIQDRRKSIGTLTGWQLLAGQVVAAGDDDEAWEAAAGSPHPPSDASAFGVTTGSTDSMGGSSSLSDDSSAPLRGGGGAGAAAAEPRLAQQAGGGGAAGGPPAIVPRPHQWLYREYKLLEEIGSGGFGRVCKARHLSDGRLVVVKEIKTTTLTPKQKAATLDEMEILARLDHPNVVRYRDTFADDVYINIVMEHCDAGDLGALVKGRKGVPLPEDDVMRLFVQIVLALHYIHGQGVLHRDLKPQNVLATNAGLLKVGDFGVSKMSRADASMACTVVGTPHYLSPEMCDNKPYGRKSDVWALGCILVELCTLSKAFDSNSISKIILSVMAGAHQPVPETYSPELRALVAALLQVSPAQRPSAQEILSMPFVRQHLLRYLEWARGVPDARIDTVLGALQHGPSGGLRAAASARRMGDAAAAAAAPAPAPAQAPPAAASAADAAVVVAASAGSASARSSDSCHSAAQRRRTKAAAALAAVVDSWTATAAAAAAAIVAPGGAHAPSPQQQKQQQQQQAGALEAQLFPSESLAATLSGVSSAGTGGSSSAPALTLVQEQMEGFRRLSGLKRRLLLAAGGGGGAGLGSPVYAASLVKAMSADAADCAAAAAPAGGLSTAAAVTAASAGP